MTKHILCFSGGKDSTAMLITLLRQQKPIDDILYIDTGSWMWNSAKEHLQQVEQKLDVTITRLDVSEDIRKGFLRWGFPSMLNRWCTGIKRDVMGKYIKDKYGERESLIQYIGYCADECKRIDRDIYTKKQSIHWLKQESPPNKHYRFVKNMVSLLGEYMNIIVIITVGCVHCRQWMKCSISMIICLNIGRNYEICSIRLMDTTIMDTQYLI